MAAREKQKLIKEKFRSWVFTDPERTERLVRTYNDTYNNLRPRLFDGGHLDFPGMNQTLTLRPHQKDAVWRGMSSGNTLLAHVVGAGKTFTMAATGMKMKEAGLIKKPMYVVPNHLLEQFAREFMQLYPNARLLVAAKEDLTRNERTAMKIGKHALAREDVPAVLGGKLDSLPSDVRDATRIPIGTYRGLTFGVILHPHFPPDVYLEGETTRTYGLSKEHRGPRAALNALERIAGSYDSEIVRLRNDAGIAQGQLRDYHERLGKQFIHEGYLNELTTLRDALKIRLSDRDDAPEGEGPGATELATRIKGLKAANTIESGATRSERKPVVAEQSVTARIRRRQEEARSADEPAQEANETLATDEMSFRERIRRERQQNAEGEGHGPP